jgi:hypothetical protein
MNNQDFPLVKIFLGKNEDEPIIQPVDKLWNDIRHTRSSIAFLKSLIEESQPNRGFIKYWQAEIEKLQEELKFVQNEFTQTYITSLCVLKEFEITKYDRAYLEIAFIHSL